MDQQLLSEKQYPSYFQTCREAECTEYHVEAADSSFLILKIRTTELKLNFERKISTCKIQGYSLKLQHQGSLAT